MAIKTEQVSLDIQPCCDARGPVVCGRQGDEGTVLNVTVTQNGQAMPLDGLTAKLLGNNPNLLQLVGTVSGSTATFTLPSAFFSAVGIVRLYVQLAQGSDVVASTQTFTLKVAPGADLSASQAQGYVTQLDEALATAKQASQTAETAAEQATQAVDDANEALQTANTAVQNANTAATAANAAAENANSAAAAARGNVLKGTLGPAPLLSADDAYATKPRKLTVHGETRQNLWVNPSGTNNGVTAKANADGSVTLSGTATGAANLYSNASYNLRPGSTYYMSCSPNPNGFNLGVTQYVNGVAKSTKPMPTGGGEIVIDSDVTHVTCVIYGVASGQTVSGTYHIMLNEGSEPEPWCPPGLNSVDELSIVTAGKNLAIVENIGTGQENYNKLVSPKLAEGVYTVSGILRKNTVVNIKDGSNSGDTISSHVESLPKTLSIRAGQSIFVNAFNTGQVDKSVNIISNIQIELGSTATAYEPPNITTTPIDLDGNTLCSLPDGTHDELTIDATGAVTLTKRTSVRIADTAGVDGSVAWRTNYTCTNEGASLAAVINDGETYLCDKFPQSGGYPYVSLSATSGLVSLWNRDGSTSPKSIGDSQLPFKTIYKLVEPQTISLPPVTLPTLPAPTVNVWADAEESGAGYAMDPDVELEYERDINIAFSELQAQISATTIREATNG